MDFLQFKIFCRSVIESGDHPLPVQVEMLDRGMNPFFKTEIRLNSERTYVFSRELVGELSPCTVRFTPQGKPAFLRDFPAAS